MKFFTTLLYLLFMITYIIVFLKSPGIAGREYYKPTEQGLEAKYKTKLEQIKNWKKEH